MAPRLFVAGASGYVGGSALDTIISHHPDWEVVALSRGEEKGEALKKAYPDTKIHIVNGTFDSGDLIKEEVSKVDIVLNLASSDHVPLATSINEGLLAAAGPSSLPDAKRYLIHTSGSGILPEVFPGKKDYGIPPQKSEYYSDIASIETLTSWDEKTHEHRSADKVVLSLPKASKGKVSTAIVAPPTIYGPGTGKAANTKSAQLPLLVKKAVERGQVFSVEAGENHWNHVHVRDLNNVYLRLFEAAANGGKGADWDAEGYYFAESGEHELGQVYKLVGKIGKEKGLLKTDEVERLSAEEIIKIDPEGLNRWGTNSLGKADRTRKVLGWEPKEGGGIEELRKEIERLFDEYLADRK